MELMTLKQKETLQLQQNLLITLLTQSPQPSVTRELPPHHLWMSTRQLANAVDIDVYRARRLLLDMVTHQKVLVTDRAIKNSLRWYPSALLNSSNGDI